MSIVKMKRLRLFGRDAEREDIMQKLMTAGCVEITYVNTDELSDEADLPIRESGSDISKWQSEERSIENALAVLDKYAPVKTPVFSDYRPVEAGEFFDEGKYADSLSVSEEILRLGSSVIDCDTQQKTLIGTIDSLEPWEELDVPLEFDGTANTVFRYYALPTHINTSALEKEFSENAPGCVINMINKDKENIYCSVVAHRDSEKAVHDCMSRFNGSAVTFGDERGTPAERKTSILSRIDKLEDEKQSIIIKIREMGKCREQLQAAYDRALSGEERASAESKLLNTGQVFVLEGWVPEPDTGSISKILDECCADYYFEDPKEDDTVPVKLKNNRLTAPLNMVTKMYSLPDYSNTDPNPLIMPFFVIFFGFMYADLGYGIILLVLGLVVGRMVRKPGTLKNMTGLLVECGVTTAFFGMIFGSCFGDAINYIPALKVLEKLPFWALKDPTSDPMWFMYVSLIFGAIHLIFGMVVHLILEIRDGHPWEGFFDVVPWWTVFAGIGCMLFFGMGFWYVLLAGIVFLVATQGRHKKGFLGKLLGGLVSIYDITNWLGDILSYTRLMALMLAGGVIAQVFNMLGSLPGSIIVFVIIFIFGHLFNMGINIIGTYVHSARLQYLEFFGKFYKDGGQAFAPLAYKSKYTKVVQQDRS